jgi:deoxyribodipyrimidine photo-lyase
MTKNKTQVSIFWFRRDLRLTDNIGLISALQSKYSVLPIFIFDTEILSKLDDKADKRVDLIHQMLSCLKSELEEVGSTLLVLHGKPEIVFEKLFVDYDVKGIFANRDYEPYALQRDNSIENLAESKQVFFQTNKDQVVFEWNEILKSDKTPYTVFTPYSKIWKNKFNEIENFQTQNEVNYSNLLKTSPFSMLELFDLGFNQTNVVYSKPAVDITNIQEYEKTRNFPALEKGTSMMSVHLRFGTVSVRELVSIAQQYNEQWLNELIWREFFMTILKHFPKVENQSFKKQYDEIQWRNSRDEFAAWCEGRTGFPIVDAGMRQLNETGLMHNRVRMIVASFLVKDLLIDWRWGEAYFAQKLLDYDLSANNGNWQWAAGCGCDAAPYFRIFNPTTQSKQYDPELIYVKRWVKDLNEFGYPQPIVDHAMARERTLTTYKHALNQ